MYEIIVTIRSKEDAETNMVMTLGDISDRPSETDIEQARMGACESFEKIFKDEPHNSLAILKEVD